MMSTRREFINRIGIAITALVMARCAPTVSEGDSLPKATREADADCNLCTPTASGSDAPRDRLRDCWRRLDWLAQQTRENWESYEQGEQPMRQLVAEHRAALNDLVAIGELNAKVAGQIESAFGAAAYHVWRSNAPMTCYEPMLLDYKPTGSGQLVRQAELLAELAETESLDPNTVARAQAVVERDIAFLSLSDAETQVLYDALIKAAGDTYDFPSFDELDLEISPEAVQAARFLVELLPGE